jgi:hypothetical protein
VVSKLPGFTHFRRWLVFLRVFYVPTVAMKSGVDTSYCVIDTVNPVSVTGFTVFVTGLIVTLTDYSVLTAMNPVTDTH